MSKLLITDNIIYLPNGDYEVQKITTKLAKALYEIYAPLDGIHLKLTYTDSFAVLSALIENNLSLLINSEFDSEIPTQILLFSVFPKSEDITYSFHLFTQKVKE
jgi:hypothetical protein